MKRFQTDYFHLCPETTPKTLFYIIVKNGFPLTSLSSTLWFTIYNLQIMQFLNIVQMKGGGGGQNHVKKIQIS